MWVHRVFHPSPLRVFFEIETEVNVGKTTTLRTVGGLKLGQCHSWCSEES